MASRISPCRDCGDRTSTCHDSCAAYIAWAEEKRAMNRAITVDKKMAAIVEESHAVSVKRVTSGHEARRKRRREGRE